LLLLAVGSKIFPDERKRVGKGFPLNVFRPPRMVEEACLLDVKKPFATIMTKGIVNLAAELNTVFK